MGCAPEGRDICVVLAPRLPTVGTHMYCTWARGMQNASRRKYVRIIGCVFVCVQYEGRVVLVSFAEQPWPTVRLVAASGRGGTRPEREP